MIAELVMIAALSASGSENFDAFKTGTPPDGWTASQTGTGQAKWLVEPDPTAPSAPNVLKQSGAATFPICLKDDTSLTNGFVDVKFKPIAGKTDQAGGLIWRAKDANNYYVARANALEDNVAIYHTINGRRAEKKRANMKVASNAWHTLRVDFSGTRFVVTYDGMKAIEWDDDTFKEAGKVGVWTKADSVTAFDDFRYGAIASSNPAVVFVCEHGAAKSLIATTYFNKIAAERGLRVRATYRGVSPQADLSVDALKGLREDGLLPPDQKPSSITQEDVDSASVVFAMGCTLPKHAAASGKADSWDDVPDDKGYAAMRDAIKRHVERLVDDMLKQR